MRVRLTTLPKIKLDVSASYPNGEAVFNVSKETTARELLEIEGVDESVRRKQGINLSAGATNAVEFCTEMFGLPTFEQLFVAYSKHLEQKQKEMIAA